MSDYRFEAEHLFAESLWNSSVRAFLDFNGYTKNMVGNQIGLFSDPQLVRQLQNLPANCPVRKAQPKNMRYWRSISAIVFALVLTSCSQSPTEYPEFDRDFAFVVEPMRTIDWESPEIKAQPNPNERKLDLSYIDHHFRGAVLCTSSGYGADLGGVPDAVFDGRVIVPGRRPAHNGGNSVAVVTPYMILNFSAYVGGVAECRSRLGLPSNANGRNCVSTKGATQIAQFDRLGHARIKRTDAKRYAHFSTEYRIEGDCPNWDVLEGN